MRAGLLVLLLLGGCATAAKPVTPPAPAHCVPLTTYTPAQEQAAAAALAGLPSDSPLVAFMADYGAMRAADRACLAQ